MTVCQDESLVPSSRILDAARRLDKEGFWLAVPQEFVVLHASSFDVKAFDCGKPETLQAAEKHLNQLMK